MIDGLDIVELTEVRYYNKYNNIINTLGDFSKINIFIGENNCGKSKLIRSFTNTNHIIYSKENITNKKSYNRDFFLLKDNIQTLKNELNNLNIKEKFYDILKIINELEHIENNKEYFYFAINLKEKNESLKYILNRNNSHENRIFNIIENINIYINNIKNELKYNNGLVETINRKNIIYIPILRGIENFELYFNKPTSFSTIKMTESEFEAFNQFKANAKTVYENKISKTYHISKEKIFTAERLYENIMNKLLGNEKEREFVKKFEQFISEKFYDNISFSITPNLSKRYLGIKIGNNTDRELYNLGDGIKQLIVIFYKLFEEKDNETIFLIEEPELNLHPGFQRKFMEIILKEFLKHQFFITTHSNHIIDFYDDENNISLFKFKNANKENSKFYIEKVLKRDVSILEEIGARSSSVFMANCTIWVEGISDRIYLSKYLKLYFDENNMRDTYKEDIHYSFIEYGGNNITHWSFVDNNDIETINASSISHNVFLICDNDNNKKIERKEKLRRILGDKLYILKSREIENILSKKALEETLKKDNKIDELTYKRKSEYSEENYAKPNIKMAKFIDSTFELKKTYSDKYGMLKNKSDFAKKAISVMNSFDDLSDEAKELTDKIVEFIIECNNK